MAAALPIMISTRQNATEMNGHCTQHKLPAGLSRARGGKFDVEVKAT
jgi:hypothetical protein